MARTRWDYIQRKKAETGQTGTATYDLPETGFMPQLMLTAYFTPTGAAAPSCPLSDALTKIEIVDGGLVIKSLTGNQVKGLSMIHGHNPLGSTEINDNAVEGHDQFFIDMGGTYNGIKYAPDMAQFNNPQIRLTWDCSFTTTEFGMTTEADTTPAIKFSLLAELLKEAGGYQHGYVKSSIIKEFTQATSTTNTIEIPKGDQLIGIGVEAGYSALDFTEDVEQIKLDIDNGDWIPFNLYEDEIMPFQQMIYGTPFQYSWMSDIESADEFDSHMGYLLHLLAQSKSSYNEPMAIAFESTHKGVETMYITDTRTPTPCDTLQSTYLTAIGWAPFHLWYVPCSALLKDKDTLDTSALGRVELELTSGSSASTSSTPDVIAEFLRI